MTLFADFVDWQLRFKHDVAPDEDTDVVIEIPPGKMAQLAVNELERPPWYAELDAARQAERLARRRDEAA